MTPAEPAVDVLAGARQAASVIVMRDRPGTGFEVLMLRRAEREGDVWSGAAVFPGGALAAGDRDAHRFVTGWDDARASARLQLPEGGLDYFVAAVRECFEEVGLLLARGVTDAQLARAHAEWRGPLQRGERSLAALCESLALTLDLTGWELISHWLTPLGTARRFDTRFFVARAPEAQRAEADMGEAQQVMWLSPQDALAPGSALKLVPVTREVLRLLTRFASVEEVLAHARALPRVDRILPRRSRTAAGASFVMPGDAAYDEVARLDPTGHGRAWSDLEPGRAVALSPRLVRVTAPNAGVMTGAGTNSYLVGDPEVNRWTVVDPGEDDAAHLDAIVRAAPGPIERILVTHTHPDHSPGAAPLARRTGAPVLGLRPRHAEHQDMGFAPDAEPVHGDTFHLGPTTTLRVLHTPGHAANHLAFLLVEERTLLAGDHVMQGGTVIIDPPDGDMAAYLASLEAMRALDLDWIAPGHGFLIARPGDVVQGIIRHRLAREAKVVAALRDAAGATLAALVPVAYADTPPALHPLAERSLLAHLIKLEGEGRARRDGEGWSLVA
jgi:glyoxylase-like metal-dependent hydrolase (beta-lactamase superfamily II)/8-oxo-dGTP pyrophosphatase MutT (NUDIX family)